MNNATVFIFSLFANIQAACSPVGYRIGNCCTQTATAVSISLNPGWFIRGLCIVGLGSQDASRLMCVIECKQQQQLVNWYSTPDQVLALPFC